MQSEPAERRRQPRRSKRSEGGHGRAEPRGPQPRSAGSSEEEMTRLKGIVVTATRQKDKQRTGERGRGGDEEEEGEREGRDRGRGDGDKRRKEEKEARSRRAASEGGEESGTMRWRLHQLEKERLELTSAHNQELCRLQAELARLRAGVERGEAQRAELQYQLTASQRDAARATALSRDKRTLTERAAELQLTVEELQKVVDITRRARDEDQHALQQEVEERDKLIQNFSSENQRLHRLLQDQEEALEESERRMAALQKEREREGEKEAEANRRQADQLKYLAEREERSRREKEVLDQKVKSLESSIEAERAAHLESKFNSEIIQVRGRELEAALAAERSGVELLRTRLREAERALQRLQQQYEQCKSDLSVALEKDKTTTSDLTEQLEEEKRRHADTHTLLEQAAQRQSDSEECLKHIRETLQQHINTVLAKDAGNWSLPADVLQLLKAALGGGRQRLETAVGQVQDLLCASERLHDENQRLRRLTEETQQASVRLEEEVTRLRQESSDWSTQSRGLQAELHKEREEREERKREQEREREERKREKEREREEREREKEREREEREREKEREREERVAEVQKITDNYQKESKVIVLHFS
ncbi:trichohyalin-like, partial [Sander lucioperca]|uniref:trichohyalin-like n=1 Tax=Sander lucioperca TaxID=283035 RepID=UPI001653AF6E